MPNRAGPSAAALPRLLSRERGYICVLSDTGCDLCSPGNRGEGNGVLVLNAPQSRTHTHIRSTSTHIVSDAERERGISDTEREPDRETQGHGHTEMVGNRLTRPCCLPERAPVSVTGRRIRDRDEHGMWLRSQRNNYLADCTAADSPPPMQPARKSCIALRTFSLTHTGLAM